MNGPSGIGGGAAGIQQILAMRQQILDRSQLLQELHGPAAAPADPPVAEPGSFAQTLKGAIDSVAERQNAAEDLTAGWQRGEVTDIAKVMLARQEAGVAFEATLQVRNRLLSAYQDIMRMGV